MALPERLRRKAETFLGSVQKFPSPGGILDAVQTDFLARQGLSVPMAASRPSTPRTTVPYPTSSTGLAPGISTGVPGRSAGLRFSFGPNGGPTTPVFNPQPKPGNGTVLSDPCALLPSYLQNACRGVGTQLPFGPYEQEKPKTTTYACPEGTIRIGENCVALGDAFPGGDPFITGAGGAAVTGSFGIPGVTPVQMQRRHLKCPRGFVLGTDEVCYPKAILPRRSQFRKWKGDRRPPVSVSDMQAIRQAKRAKDRVKKLAGDVGFSTKRR